MIDLTLFETIKRKHGSYASWAVWASAGEKPKSNMGDTKVFNLDFNPGLLAVLNPQVVMVGLNFSRTDWNHEPFGNFHDPHPSANDFKIRYAFKGTKYYGAYMTDIIKNHVMLDSKDLLKDLKPHPEKIKEHVSKFREEMHDLSCQAPVILAFGKDAYDILRRNLRRDEYSLLVRLTHYSHQISKENYQIEVFRQIAEAHEAGGQFPLGI
jgi:hypothetical protein